MMSYITILLMTEGGKKILGNKVKLGGQLPSIAISVLTLNGSRRCNRFKQKQKSNISAVQLNLIS